MMPSSSDPKPRAPAALVEHDALPAGTRFGELELLRVLGVGGFGIVYLARDHALERDVALKEYMPASLASRGQGTQITVRSQAYAETYAAGLRSFVNEARLLARFDHPSLLKVYRFWEDNATAYMVMPYLRGRTLRDTRRAMVMPPDEAWMRTVLEPVMSALEQLHREGVYHRDIAPDNILISDDGPPVLLDFGAARRVISDRTQSLTAILKPSYAPIEQYAEMASLRQGPWTDLYALGAVVHFLLLGTPPAPATARALHDEAHPLARCGLSAVSPAFLSAIDWALSVRPQDRPRSIEDLRAALDGRRPPPPVGVAPEGVPAPRVMARAAAPAVTAFEPTLRVESVPLTVAEPAPDPDATVVIRAGAQSKGTFSDETVVVRASDAVPRQSVGVQPRAAATAVAPIAPASLGSGRRWLAALGGGMLGLAGFAYWLAGTTSATPMPAAAASEAAAVSSVPASAAAAAETMGQVEPLRPMLVPAPDTAPVVLLASPAASAAVQTQPLSAPPGPAPAAVPAAASRPAITIDRRASAAATRALLAETASQRVVRHDALTPAAVPAPPQQPQPQPAAEAPATAREACGTRVLFALWNCLERECRNPRYSQHAECVQLLENRGRSEAR